MRNKRKNITITNSQNGIFSWYVSNFVPRKLRPLGRKAFEEYRTHLNERFATRGGRDTIAYAKLVRLHFTRALSGNPLKEANGVSIDRGGLPTSFKGCRELFLIGDTESLRVLLTILSITRSIRLPVVLNTTSITDT
jgi:hypothetical protein